MTLIQLDEPIKVETPLGRGYAIMVESGNDDSWWTVILNDSGAFVTFRQEKITASRDYGYGRMFPNEEFRKIITKKD